MINLPEFDLYVFDLDDTLINTRQAYYSAQETAVAKEFPNLGKAELADQVKNLRWLCRVFGSGQPENYFSAFVESLAHKPESTPASVERLLQIYNATFHPGLKPFKGVQQYLQQLADLNKSVALVSNGKTATQLQKLHQTNLDRFFPKEICFVSEMFSSTQKKPSPHMLKLACDNAKTPASRAVYFGNMPADILSGNLAGTATVLYGPDTEWTAEAPQAAQPDYQMENWE